MKRLWYLVGAIAVLVVAGALVAILNRPANTPTISGVHEGSTASTASSTAPQATPEKHIGFIYERDAGVSSNGSPQEWMLYDISAQVLSKIDTSHPMAWEGVNGTPVVLYDMRPVAGSKETFDVSAYDLSTSSERRIVFTPGVDPHSSIAFSPVEEKIGYCVDNENVFETLNLGSGATQPYPSFTGCAADGSSFAPPEFSADGKSISYQTFGSDEYGNYDQSQYRYQTLSLDTGVSTDTPFDTPSLPSFGPSGMWEATIQTAGHNVDSFNNQLVVYDLSAVTPGDRAAAVRSGTAPIVAQDTFGDYVHLGNLLSPPDGAGLFFYTFDQKGSDATQGDYKLGYFDSRTKSITYPIGVIPDGHIYLTLIGADDNSVAFIMNNDQTGLSDLYYASRDTNKVVLVDSGTGLLVPDKAYFVESK